MAKGTRSRLGALAALLVVTLAAPATRAQIPQPTALESYQRAPALGAPMAGTIPEGMAVAGRDGQRGVPSLLVGRRRVRAAGRTPEQIAAGHLLALAPSYGLGAAALDTVEIQQARRTPAGGSVVVFRQRVNGVEVFEARLTLLMDSSGALVAAGGELHGAAASYAFDRGPESSIRVALADAFGANDAGGPSPVTAAGIGRDGHPRFALNDAGRARGYALDRPVRAYPVLYPLPERLVPAHYLELWTSGAGGGGPLWGYVVSAEDGRVLMRRLLTQDDVFTYRVFAAGASPFQPIDSPFGDTTPDAAGMATATLPGYVSPTDVMVEGLNTNPVMLADPWLPSGATITRGNNVHAYADLASPDGYGSGDFRPTTSGTDAFAFTYDPLAAPRSSTEQQSAIVTHLFFMNNWLHDYFYDAGFDEAAGNAQEDNLGRGGMEGDRLRAESMDFGGRNNANMSTPRDGSSPRMQMYLWTGFNEAGVDPGGTTLDVGTAGFGPRNFDLSAPIRLVDDGSGTTSDGCSTFTNDLTGRIALLDRGNCSFVQKVGNATSAGAVGVIVINNVSPGTITMGGTSSTMTPALMVSLSDGATLRAAEGSAVRMFRTSNPDAPSSMDSQVVAHEWGHYLHNRLVSISTTQGRAMGEGWGDFLSIFALMGSADDLTGAYPSASWSAQGANPIYYGTRRVPYSIARTFNDLSFRHISRGEPLPTTQPLGPGPADNAEVHNAGEIWATMMFDALVKMLEFSFSTGATYSFEEARQRFAHYVVTGMQLTPIGATFTEQRDAIIAAAMETDPSDARRIALAFAGRGAGSCAESPPRTSDDLVGVVEDYSVAPVPAIEEVSVAAMAPGRLCDDDDVLDAGEDGWARVAVRNDGIVDMVGASVTVSADDPAVTFPAGPTTLVPPLAPRGRTELWVAIHVDEAASFAGPVTFSAMLEGASLCQDLAAEARVALDRDPTRVDTEDFEVTPPWFAETSIDGMTTGVWSVGASALGDPDQVLRGIDSGGLTDTAVELPPVTASMTDPLVLSFEHRFEFEAETGTWWDGGVIELSVDGTTWFDVDTYVDPGYSGQLTDRASNPLSNRMAYSGTNPSSPAADTVTLDFGTALAGQTVTFRFRIGSDQAVGAPGWEIDDVQITGVMPPAFDGFAADVADCADAPIADAGPDQTATGGDLVTLDASASRDPNMDPLTFGWAAVTTDPAITLSDPAVIMPTFTAPDVTEARTLTLRVRVSDGTGSSTDDVEILIEPAAPPMVDAGPPPIPGTDAGPPPMPGTDAGPRPMTDRDGGGAADAGAEPMDDGCSCRAAGAPRSAPGAPLALAALGLGLLLRRRRR